jgi:hypothetical protein
MPEPPDATGRTIQTENLPPISLDDVRHIAAFYGWTVQKQGDGWLLTLPTGEDK